jgi:peptide/nickel transport system substrate-binding protein
MVMDLRSGKLAGAWGIPPAQIDDLSGDGLEAVSYVIVGFDHLTFNCAPAPAYGHPVLRDSAFRRALSHAIDRERMAEVAYAGEVLPATSVIPSGLHQGELDYHWDPGPQTHRFDLAEAAAELDAAGYADGDGDGLREDRRGRPIRLRLFARAESPTTQQSGRLIVGWFRSLGLSIELQVMSEAALAERVWNTEDGDLRPDYDMFLAGLTGDVDPGFLLSALTTDQIGMWNRAAWSNREYDLLFELQSRQIAPEQRQRTVWSMQEIAYEQTPLIPLVYSRWQEAYDVAEWAGWVTSPAVDGGVFFTFMTDSYRTVHPVAESEVQPSRRWPIGQSVIVAVVVLAAAALLHVRSRRMRIIE